MIVTKNHEVLCNQDLDLASINNCNHEEADTRMILHSVHARSAGFNKVIIRTVDTDVVVRGETWIGFGTGKDFNFIQCVSLLQHFLRRYVQYFHFSML